MTIGLVHPFESGKADGTDATRLQPSYWNADHVVTMATARVLGRITASAGAIEELDADDLYTLLGWVSTTAVPFAQTAAPTGWTKQSTNNDTMLRVVTGSVSTGGTIAFSTLNAFSATDSHTITTGEMPSHLHTYSGTTGASGAHTHTVEKPSDHGAKPSSVSGSSADWGDADGDNSNTGTSSTHTHTCTGTTGSTGSGGGHTHTLTFGVQYVDVIYATKD